MAKSCPVNHAHTTREVQLGPNLAYSYCQDCKEDVDYLARQRNQEWDENNDTWVAKQANQQANPNRLGRNQDEEDEDEDGFDPAVNPPNWNPNPVRVMGGGTRQIMIHNDPQSAAHLVQEILMRVFGKDAMEAQYIMMDAHYHGQAVAFYTNDDVEAQRLIDQIEALKQTLEASGCIGADRVKDIRFTVQARPNQQPPAPANP